MRLFVLAFICALMEGVIDTMQEWLRDHQPKFMQR